MSTQSVKGTGFRVRVRTPLTSWFRHEGRVPHISLVFREMWDTSDFTAQCIS
jgi:hypothetical protein